MSKQQSADSTPDAIYDQVIKELGLPHPIPEQFGITKDSIQDAYYQCIKYNYTTQQAKDLIIKMWKNSIQLK
jgi:hypothetical protein